MSAHRILFTCVLWAWGATAFALNTALDVSQYAHAGWTRREGFTTGIINTIAQTPDGYLWLGTDFGLLRFDGVRATPWQPPAGQELPSNEVHAVLGTRDGSLWIGTTKGLARWKANTLIVYAQLAGRNVLRLLEDRDGVLWVAVLGLPRGGLCAVGPSTVTCKDDDPRFGYGVWGLFEDSRGNLWGAVSDGFFRWKPGPVEFIPVPGGGDSLRAFDEHDGTLHVGTPGGIRELRDGTLHPSRLPSAIPASYVETMRRDRDGALWIGTGDRGVVHVHEGRVDSFSLANGLSSPSVTAMFEDREGNMWVATQNGLDRFSESSVSLVSMEQGVAGSAYSVLADGPDTVWIGTSRGLHRWRRGPVTAVETDPRRKNSVFGGLLRDRGGRIWGSTLEGIGYLEGGRFTTLRSPRGIIRDFVQQRSGTIWAAAQIAGLLQLDPKGVVRQIAWSTFDRKDFATVLAADPAGEGLWLGFYEGGIAFFDGDVRRAYGDKDGLIGGRVNDLRFDQDGALWISTQSGLSRLEGGRFSTVPRLGGLSCAAVHWTIRDDAGALWLYTPCGLARVLRDDVPAWTAASSSGQGAAHVTPVTILNNSDGVMSELLPSGLRPLVAKGGDGRLWFSAANGVQVVDPKHLAFNRVAPPVYVERVVANHVGYEIANMPTTNLRLTAQVRDLVIDYTALSLVAPEKMRFRYKLEGWDNDWQDVGTRRQAFYTNLPPRRYRFRVMASNNSGVWNETGAAVDFAIEPAYYQTAWFLLLVVGLVLAAISGAHRIRLRFVETHEREITALNERLMKAQEQERMRIAGELHDGVAQEMLAATMLLGTARRRIPDDSPAKVTIDKVQEKLIKMGTDIRQISHHLHPPVLQEAGLPEAVRNYCEQFSASSAIAVPCETDEAARDLSPGAALALYRIMQEAIGNAAKHARATRIGVRVTRANGTVSLIVEDDGVGFARDALGSSQGLGLVTMRERAGQLGGTFQIESAPGRGTTIRVDIPFR